MEASHPLPDLGLALPLGSEPRWSDMLAVLIATDPVPICRLLRLSVEPELVTVEREVAVDSASRPDLVLWAGERRVAVVEVKVLAGLGPKQLDRYAEAARGAEAYALVFPERLQIDLQRFDLWQGLTWENLLREYRQSRHPWVAASAEAWLLHLDRSVPPVGPDTVWNDLVHGEDFVIAMRSRMTWVHRHIDPAPPVAHDLVVSAAGVSWVARLFAPARREGYRVIAEIEETLPVRDFPKWAGPEEHQPRGPSAKMCLVQEGVDTSAGFDWDYLLAMWPIMRDARSDWVTNAARPKAAHDRENHRAMIEKGGPRHLGIGFGEAQARMSGACMFGARIQFPADIRLRDLTQSLQDVGRLVVDMATVESPWR